MQINTFVGNLAKAPVQTGAGDRAVTKFSLISNEFAGKDDDGKTRERQVSIQFTAFRGLAEAIAKNTLVGDQLIVTYRIENNHYQTKDGEDVYGYNFIVDNMEFGAPGKQKREQFKKAV